MTKSLTLRTSLLIAMASTGGLATFHSAPATAQSCPNGVCPPVVVTAPRQGGGTVVCYGMDCAGILGQLSWQPPYLPNVDSLPEDTGVDGEEFCDQLSDQRPDGCEASGANVPWAPGINTSPEIYAAMYANGCGDGSLAFHAANLWAGQTIGGYTGNPDEPLPGLVIRDVCNLHDACYAGNGSKPACDAAFGSALEARLASQYVPGSAAYQFASDVVSAYSAAVGLLGTSAFENAASAYRCAVWNANMDANQCAR